MTFLQKRNVWPTPPSLVKLCCKAAALNMASGTTTPMMDHVPELIQTLSSPGSAGTAATALPVSWHAGAMTGREAMAKSWARDGNRSPMCVPGCTMGLKMPVDMSKSLPTISHAQSMVRGLKHCVVVALVNSLKCSPVNQKLNRSGIVRKEKTRPRSGKRWFMAMSW